MRALLLTPVVVLALTACEPAGPAPVEGPRLAELSTAARTPLIDRAALLDGARDFDQADAGDALDLGATGAGYRMELDGSAITEPADGLPRSYSNYLAGVTAVVAADLTTALVIGPPAVGIGVAASGDIAPIAPNVWRATNTVDVLGQPVTAQLTVAWVGVGWISEMRYSNADVQDQLWFQGFVSHDGALGWWDLFDGASQHAGSIEWATDGTNGELGYGAVIGENAGDWVLYASIDGTNGVTAFDASRQEQAWVVVDPDLSGVVRLPDWNAGVEACWDTDLLDTPCE